MENNVEPARADLYVSLHRAGNVGKASVPTLAIHVIDEIPDNMELEAVRNLYDEQGKTLCDALFSHLPGGTIDALIRNLLERRASLFRIPFELKEDRQ